MHKAKGLEWDTIVLADDFVDLTQWSASESIQEVNALYVAITRCRKKLQLPPSLEQLYKSQSEAVALVPSAVARAMFSGIQECPCCGSVVKPPSSWNFCNSDNEGAVVAVGSASLRRYCMECVARAPCPLANETPNHTAPYS